MKTISVSETRSMKYIYNHWVKGEEKIYDLLAAGHENIPREDLEGAEARELKSFYQQWRKKHKTGRISYRSDPEPEPQKALKALGYLQ